MRAGAQELRAGAGLVLQTTADGRIDLEALEGSATTPRMEDWLRRRLQGQDPYWSVDPDSPEAAERVFLRIWKASAPTSRVRHALGEACAALLREAWGGPPEQWHGELLALVRVIRPDSCRPALRRAVEAGRFTDDHLTMDLDQHWLNAAAAYRWDAAAVIDAWKRLLATPPYNVIAYRALAHDLELGIWYLPHLYHGLKEQERPFVLRQAVRLLLHHVQSDWAARLRWREGHLAVHAGLCEAVDAALRELNRPPVFERATSSPPSGAVPEDTGGKFAGIAAVQAAS